MASDRIKEVLKSKVKTSIDSGVNDIMGQFKLSMNQSIEKLIDQSWPLIVRELRAEWDAEKQAEEANKKEQIKKISETIAKQNLESQIKQAQSEGDQNG